MITFHTIYKGKHGHTTSHDNPKTAAYIYVANMITENPARRYRLTCHADGSYTVYVDGLAPATFEQGV